MSPGEPRQERRDRDQQERTVGSQRACPSHNFKDSYSMSVESLPTLVFSIQYSVDWVGQQSGDVVLSYAQLQLM